jgi:hypothetical protein
MIPGGTSDLGALGRGSPEWALFGSVCLGRSGGCTEGPGRLSGLLGLEVKVSRVVTCTLSVLRSSTTLFARCNPDVVLLWLCPDAEG